MPLPRFFAAKTLPPKVCRLLYAANINYATSFMPPKKRLPSPLKTRPVWKKWLNLEKIDQSLMYYNFRNWNFTFENWCKFYYMKTVLAFCRTKFWHWKTSPSYLNCWKTPKPRWKITKWPYCLREGHDKTKFRQKKFFSCDFYFFHPGH